MLKNSASISSSKNDWTIGATAQSRTSEFTTKPVNHKSDWEPGGWGKGILAPDGTLYTWKVDEQGIPHHGEYLDKHQPYEGAKGYHFKIRMKGGLDTTGYNMTEKAVEEILEADPRLHKGKHTEVKRYSWVVKSMQVPMTEWPLPGHESKTGAAGDGDGYIQCAQGHHHWGVNGAAGLMLRHVDPQGQTRYLLTHRSPEVMHGDTYSVPGGALDSHETPEQGAVREASEELGPIGEFKHTGTQTIDHGGWAYHTVHGDVPEAFTPKPQNWETEKAGWFTPEEIDQLPLHPGFASYWQNIRHMAKTAPYMDELVRFAGSIPKAEWDQMWSMPWQHEWMEKPSDEDIAQHPPYGFPTYPHEPGQGVMYHTAPTRNREAYEREGIRAHGDPEVDPEPAVFMTPRHPSESIDPDVRPAEGSDVWEINVGGLPIKRDPWGEEHEEEYLGDLGGSHYHAGDIPPERIKRIASDSWQTRDKWPNPESDLDADPERRTDTHMYHISPKENRQNIEEKGLIPNYISGIGLPTVFLSPEPGYTHTGDIWRVNTEGLDVQPSTYDTAWENGGEHVYHDPEPIEPRRLELVPAHEWPDRRYDPVVQKENENDPSSPAGKVEGPRTWNRTARPADPEWWSKGPSNWNWYHGTEHANLPSIMEKGLVPWDDPENPVSHNWGPEPELRPRPGHVYLGENPDEAANLTMNRTREPGIIVKVDPRYLQHEKINPDEDYWVFGKSPESEVNWNKSRDNQSYGDMAERTGLGEDPSMTAQGIKGTKTMAYRGRIPPEALTPHIYNEQAKSWEELPREQWTPPPPPAPRRAADQFDTREYADSLQQPHPLPDIKSEPHADYCTCSEGKKLDCPMHGMKPNPEAQRHDHLWHIPEGSPVSYPQDQPSNYQHGQHGASWKFANSIWLGGNPECPHNDCYMDREGGVQCHECGAQCWGEGKALPRGFEESPSGYGEGFETPGNIENWLPMMPEGYEQPDFSKAKLPPSGLQRNYGATEKKKLWLDDTRRPPDSSWEWARNVQEAIYLLQTENREFDHMSLDHDLDMVRYKGKVVQNPDALSGGDFILWLHEHGDKKHMPKSVNVHSHNQHAVDLMVKALDPHVKVTVEEAPDELEEPWARDFKVHEPSEIKKEQVHLPEQSRKAVATWHLAMPDYYHFTTPERREEIERRGLEPRKPSEHNWPEYPDQPTGVYAYPEETAPAHTWDTEDVWRIPEWEVEKQMPDPEIPRAVVIQHPVGAELVDRAEDVPPYDYDNWDRFHQEQQRYKKVPHPSPLTPHEGSAWDVRLSPSNNPISDLIQQKEVERNAQEQKAYEEQQQRLDAWKLKLLTPQEENPNPWQVHLPQKIDQDLPRIAGKPKKPPKLREGTAKEHCGNCLMYWKHKAGKGRCWGYGEYKVRDEQTCDSWTLETRESEKRPKSARLARN